MALISRGFRFPLQNFSDEKALFTNFRHLQDYLNQIFAAVIVVEEAAITDHGGLTGLTDDDHSQYILETLVDAKGDLLPGTANDTVARLAVGANGKILSANSTQATGLEWIDPPAGGAAAGFANILMLGGM